VEDLPEAAAVPVVAQVASFEEEHHPGAEDSLESFLVDAVFLAFVKAGSQCTTW
jgi:hypothetical protein